MIGEPKEGVVIRPVGLQMPGLQSLLVDTLNTSLERSRTNLSGLEARLAGKQAEHNSYADLVNRSKEIESAHKSWQKIRKELEAWDVVASKFHEREKGRVPLLEKIAVEKAHLEQELQLLQEQEKVISEQSAAVLGLGAEIEKMQTLLAEAEERVQTRAGLEAQRNSARERQAELKAENEALKADMNQLKERIDTLQSAEGASCPLCGQELSEAHRMSTLEQLEVEGRQKGDRYRANQAERAAAEELARQNADILSSLDVEAVVTACASCGLTFKREYPGLLAASGGDRVRVLDIHEFLSDKMSLLDLQPAHSLVTRHDPCHLGRGQGLAQTARDVLRSVPGIEFIEMREPAQCCGFGGVMRISHPTLSGTIGEKRARDIAATQASLVVTGCPGCRMQIADSLRKAGSEARVVLTSSPRGEGNGCSRLQRRGHSSPPSLLAIAT